MDDRQSRAVLVMKKYTYNAKVKSVYDGDTVKVDIDLGFDVWLKDQTIRLYGINAPEVKGETKTEGLSARDRLRDLVLNKDIVLETIRDNKEKFGRWLGKLYVDSVCINETLLNEKHAQPYLL